MKTLGISNFGNLLFKSLRTDLYSNNQIQISNDK